jgi:2-amino-4-hydroxy-6-hydroxymethyldihydropteridine diphosphokinase
VSSQDETTGRAPVTGELVLPSLARDAAPLPRLRPGPTFSSAEHRAVVALGSNLGPRLELLEDALNALADTPGCTVTGVSPVYETEPVTGPAAGGDQPSYLNAVVLIETHLNPYLLLDRGQAIEAALGRVRSQRWGPRTIDVDLICYDTESSHDEELILPHPRAHERAFVLAPWHDVDPSAELPGRGSVADLLAAAGSDGVRRRDDLELRLSE